MHSNTTTSTSASSLEVVVEEFKPHETGHLVGFFTLVFPAVGIRIRDVTFHAPEGKTPWVGWPSRKYTRNGMDAWQHIVEGADRASHFKLQAVCVRAIQQYLDGLKSKAPWPTPTKKETASDRPPGPPPPRAEIPI